MKKINSKKNKPAKKSRFAARLEAIQKQQQQQSALGGRKPQPKKKNR